jgi:hypothetical protein
MMRIVLMLVLLYALPIGAQDSEDEDRTATESPLETTDAEPEEEVDDELIDDSSDYAREDEDDFIPSDEVTYEQAIPFPTDI